MSYFQALVRFKAAMQYVPHNLCAVYSPPPLLSSGPRPGGPTSVGTSLKLAEILRGMLYSISIGIEDCSRLITVMYASLTTDWY